MQPKKLMRKAIPTVPPLSAGSRGPNRRKTIKVLGESQLAETSADASNRRNTSGLWVWLKQRFFDAAGQAKAAQLTGGDSRQKNRVRPALATASYARFFFFSAQRFFIASDNRFLPAGVNPLRFGRPASLPGAALAALEPTVASKVMA